MPRRSAPWPGASADKIEQLVTRRIEERIAENARVERIESTSRGSVAVIVIALDERTEDARKELDDIALRLSSIRDLPAGAGPIEFLKDFGDTAALMLTVASPKVGGIELELRARGIRTAIEQARREATGRARLGRRAPSRVDRAEGGGPAARPDRRCARRRATSGATCARSTAPGSSAPMSPPTSTMPRSCWACSS